MFNLQPISISVSNLSMSIGQSLRQIIIQLLDQGTAETALLWPKSYSKIYSPDLVNFDYINNSTSVIDIVYFPASKSDLNRTLNTGIRSTYVKNKLSHLLILQIDLRK